MKSYQSKNITPSNSNHLSFLQKENSKTFFAKNNKPFFNALPVQAKLTVNQPNDPDSYRDEQEADAMANKVVQGFGNSSFSNSENNSAPFFNKPNHSLQRKCAECEEEEKLQKKTETTSSQTASASVAGNLNSSKGSGNPLPHNARTKMESSFGTDFSHVRIHNDNAAVQMSKDLHAQAFTHGSDIYFNSGKYDTNKKEGQQLLAHELTHVIQQKNGSRIQKQDESTSESTNQEVPSQTSESVTPTEEPSTTLSDSSNQQGQFIVDDSEIASEMQMNKSEFIQRLNSEVCSTVDEALAGTPFSSNNCPYIRAAFARHQGSSPAQIEQLLQRYEPATRSAQSADDIISIVKVRVQNAVTQWKKTGDLSSVPADIAAQIPGSLRAASGLFQTVSSAGSLLFKAESGGAQATQSPASVMQSLGTGSTLNGSTRSKMESAFGTNFSNVQIHTDSHAANLSGSMNARAFSVGNHIAFASGEHKPGTLIGDALMAHELAHVVQQQQGNANEMQSKDGAGYGQLEEDADVTAVNAVMSMRGIKGGIKDIGKQLMPRLKSGLQLQRCCTPSGQQTTVRYRLQNQFFPGAGIYCTCTPITGACAEKNKLTVQNNPGVTVSPPGREVVYNSCCNEVSGNFLNVNPCPDATNTCQ